ncbi:MAG: MBL fold metallo-hydrolase, partial [Burkholderiales bacterium]|nr:MBL fold metallo-hydrolase [Burkholderiales bacterium]
KVSRYQAGYYHFKLGDFEVAALSDGTLPIPTLKLLTNAQPGEVASRLADTYQTTEVDASVNAYLIRAGGRLILMDAGTGELYGPTLNKLEASLKGVGVTPEQITDILITHIHTDHTGGLMDGKRIVFPNATVHIEQKEVAYWLNPENRARAPEAATGPHVLRAREQGREAGVLGRPGSRGGSPDARPRRDDRLRRRPEGRRSNAQAGVRRRGQGPVLGRGRPHLLPRHRPSAPRWHGLPVDPRDLRERPLRGEVNHGPAVAESLRGAAAGRVSGKPFRGR